MTKSNTDSLLAAIKRKTPAPAKEKPVVVEQRAADRGDSRIHLWFTGEDRKLVRELAAWLAGQGERPTDSMIIRTALRMASPGNDLLTAYRAAGKQDRRLKREP